MPYRFESELWLHQAEAAWHFVTVPPDVSDDIEARSTGSARGFGSVRVHARIGTTRWSTSVFPDSARRAYVLPVKKSVRIGEAIDPGDRVVIELSLAEG